MRTLLLTLAVLPLALPIRAADDVFDRIEDALVWSSPQHLGRARVSGDMDLEEYALPSPAPGVIDANSSRLFNPRLSVFLDAQWGDHVYGFAQARLDRGFDPSGDRLRARMDEYAIRWSADAGLFDVQVGKFATVVGNWTARHDSWHNPFITAPLPYENLTGVWDNEPPRSPTQLLVWSHVRPGLSAAVASNEKYLRIPIIWGPSYAAGFAIAGALGHWRYAAEMKNASLSSRPAAWSPREAGWERPTYSGRLRYVPDERWEFGLSASSGAFLRPVADAVLLPGHTAREYREEVVAGDLTYAWHHFQLWGEVYAARFHIPLVGNADTLAYYLEARRSITPQFSLALRWNEQLYGTIVERGQTIAWGHAVSRLDLAPAYRLTPHTQLKFQYSVQCGDQDTRHYTQLLAVQFTLRF